MIQNCWHKYVYNCSSCGGNKVSSALKSLIKQRFSPKNEKMNNLYRGHARKWKCRLCGLTQGVHIWTAFESTMSLCIFCLLKLWKKIENFHLPFLGFNGTKSTLKMSLFCHEILRNCVFFAEISEKCDMFKSIHPQCQIYAKIPQNC